MIFAHTLDKLVIVGRKTQTLRPAYPGDHLARTAAGELAVYEGAFMFGTREIHRVRWIVGHDYAIQPGRGKHAIGHFRCTYLRKIDNPLKVDEAFARAEGFDSLGEFLEAWKRLYPRRHAEPCWAIGMHVLGSD